MSPSPGEASSPRRPSGLLGQTTSGAVWMLGTQTSAQVVHLLVRLVLARLLAPEDFGLVGMALAFLGLIRLFLDLGLGPALIQRADLKEGHRSSTFWGSAALGLVGFLLFTRFAPAVGAFYRTADVVPVVRALSFLLLLEIPESVYLNLLKREMRFAAVGMRHLAGIVAGGCVAISLAVAGAGVWALVAGELVRSAANSLLVVLASSWRPRLRFSRAALGELWGFGRPVVGSRVLSVVNESLSRLLIGRFLGAADLGYYTLARQALVVVLHVLAKPLSTVGFPAFTRVGDDPERRRRAYGGGISVVLLLSVPLVGAVLFLAPVLVPRLIGEAWMPAVVPLQILALVAALRAATEVSHPFFLGLGRPRLAFKWAAAVTIAEAVGMAAGLPWGVVGVCVGRLVALAALAPVHLRLVRELIEVATVPLLGATARFVACGASVGAGPLAVRLIGLEGDPAVVAALALGLLAYAAASYALLPRTWRLLRRAAESVRRPAPEASA